MGVYYYPCDYCQETWNDCEDYQRCHRCRRVPCYRCKNKVYKDIEQVFCDFHEEEGCYHQCNGCLGKVKVKVIKFEFDTKTYEKDCDE